MRLATARTARAVIVAVTLTLMQPVLAQTADAIPSQAARPASSARSKAIISVSSRISKAKILAGQDVRITGSAKPGRARDVVKVQRRDRGVWKTVKFGRLTGSRTYSFTVRPKAGKNSYRVVRPETSTGRRGTSRTVSVTAESCTPMARPTRSMAVFVTNPNLNQTAQMSRQLGRLFCAVAPNATVRVAMFLVSSDSESRVILNSLQKVHRYRGVHVEVLAEAVPYKDNVVAKLRRSVGSFATVRTCTKGCRSDVPVEGNMHQKFVTVSDMTWSKAKDPVLWTSSSNWTKKQLRRYWQTGVLMYNDRALTREFDIRFESMRACGLPGGCGTWRPSVFGTKLSAAYRLMSVNRVWLDAGLDWRQGDAGDGTRVIFSPTRPRFDPVTSELARYSCTPQHRTVRIAVFRMSVFRGASIARAFGQLRQRGCDVRAVASTGGTSTAAVHGVRDLRSQGVPTVCVDLMHDKFVYLDVVDRTTKAPRPVLWTGSQNFTGAGIGFNDDLMVAMDASTAKGQRASDIRSVAAAYRARWTVLTKHTTGCR